MNGITAVAGKDSLIIAGQVIKGVGDGDAVKLDPKGPIGAMKVSKDGNSVYALQYSGIAMGMELRLVRACFDDTTLNGLLQQWISGPDTFPLMAATYVKRVGNGKGGVASEIYQLSGGIFEFIPGAHTNTDGGLDQNYSIYKMIFRNDARLMQ